MGSLLLTPAQLSTGKLQGQGAATGQRCDEGDIADASYGADDREFRLRAGPG